MESCSSKFEILYVGLQLKVQSLYFLVSSFNPTLLNLIGSPSEK